MYYAYQITSLSNLNRTFVRVSAFNGVYNSALGGYSPATTGVPLGSVVPCNLFPYHCSSLPKDQLLYQPVAPTVSLNAQQVGMLFVVSRSAKPTSQHPLLSPPFPPPFQVANRLDLTWMQPTRDQYGFNTETVSPHTPNRAVAYTVQWSSTADFSDLSSSPTSGQYNIPAIVGDGVNMSCHVGCGHTIGQEIQNVTVASSNGYPLTSGTFSLLYVGPQNLRVYLLVAQGSPRVRVLMRSLVVNNNDFFRVGTVLYQVQSVSTAEATELVFTQPFTGGFSDITQAYYVPFPSLGLLSYSATSAQVDAYLEAQLMSLYPLYINNFDVARQTLAVGTTVGYSWLVTFTGEMFSGVVGRRLHFIANLLYYCISNVYCTSIDRLYSCMCNSHLTHLSRSLSFSLSPPLSVMCIS